MERSLYCPLELLGHTQSFKPDDWRLKVLKSLGAIYIPYNDLKKWFPKIPISDYDSIDSILNFFYKQKRLAEQEFDEYYSEHDDYTQSYESAHRETVDWNASVLENLRSSLGGILKIAASVQAELLYNGAICERLTDGNPFFDKGVLTIDTNTDSQIKQFQEGWYENPNPHDKNESFTWARFYGDGFADQYTSNSAIIIDRYIFQTKKKNPQAYLKFSVKELVDILNCIIPGNFSGTYFATIFFEFEQLVGERQWKNEIPVAECLKTISAAIVDGLRYKNVQINYVAIKDPHKQVILPKDQDWYTLHKDYFHDRKIITNYSWTIATAAINASQESRLQTIKFYPLFDGVNNPRQKRSEIPFFKIDNYISGLTHLMKTIPPQAYECFRYNIALKQIKKGKVELIENHLLDF